MRLTNENWWNIPPKLEAYKIISLPGVCGSILLRLVSWWGFWPGSSTTYLRYSWLWDTVTCLCELNLKTLRVSLALNFPVSSTPPHLNTNVACRGITANVFYRGSTMLTGAARICAKCGNFLMATSHFPLACYCFWLPSHLSWVFPSYTIMTVIQHAQLYGMQASYSAIHKAQHCYCVLRDNRLCCLYAVYASGSCRLVKNKLLQS